MLGKFVRVGGVMALILALSTNPYVTPATTFAQGARVCAVSVVSVETGRGGGRNADNPGVVLGGPEGTRAPFLSLGQGGTLVVQLGGGGASADGTPGSDLFVYESGTQAEFVFVSLSTDGASFIPVGSTGSQASGIDLDAAGFAPGTSYAYVLVQDDPNQGSHTGPETGGADIDAICGFNVANASPTAEDDSERFDQGDDYAINVLGNDSDPDDNPLTIETFTQPEGGNGNVTIDASGNATFVPNDPGFTGEVVFTYTIVDGQGGRATATVRFIIGAASPSPSASESASASASASPSPSGSEATSASASASEMPVSASPSGSVPPVDSPSPSPSDPASVEASASSEPSLGSSSEPAPSEAASEEPSPDASVAPSPDASVAPPAPSLPGEPVSNVVIFDGVVEVPVDGELSGDLATLLDNPDGVPVTFAPVDPPVNGVVDVAPGGPFSYVPFTGFGGQDAFTFTVAIGGGAPVLAQLVVSVSADCSNGALNDVTGGTPIAAESAVDIQAELRPCAGLSRTGAGQVVSGEAGEPNQPEPVDPAPGNGGGAGNGDGSNGGGTIGGEAGPEEGAAGPGEGSAVALPNTGSGSSSTSEPSLAALLAGLAAAVVVTVLVRRRLS